MNSRLLNRFEKREGYTLILHTKEIDTIYRFRGKDIHTFIDDCIYSIYKHDPFIFNDRYEYHYDKLISRDTLDYFATSESNFRNHEDTVIDIEIRNDDGKVIAQMMLIIVRRGQNTSGHWKTLANYTIANPGLSLDELIKLRKG